MQPFQATLEIIGINPYVYVPEEILAEIFEQAGKAKGPIPIRGAINGILYRQTLVKYAGAWRLYINLMMLKNSPRRIGEVVEVTIEHDPESREILPPAQFVLALAAQPEAQRVFDALTPSLRLEIVRYLARLKTKESRERNIERAIQFLLGNGRFVGRDLSQ
ncbi:YdeI/OmpD-associated family protein [Salmonirosea aquatica]|uniref:DUF1905 domain-containing protein n=1 Tax=Salmonirosea aquatica TaxID=2654236 RepID=A0A7C9FBE1_9BACT|nr:DUF1905 domain-containing protein [Cytophagaceae bacterium SJW1-29]